MRKHFFIFAIMVMICSVTIGQTTYSQELVNKAEAGNAEAQLNLGVCYSNGDGVDQDYAKAVYWFTKAAEHGYAIAQLNLGVCYGNGYGVSQDHAKAVYWYTKAAEQGNAKAQNNLGLCYKKGDGVSRDYGKAVYWYNTAAKQGHTGAQRNLGYCYYNGNGVDQDPVKGIYWLSKAAEQGDADAQTFLGVCYYIGSDVSQDSLKAVYWWERAAEQGYAIAQFSLGNYYIGNCYDCNSINKDKAIYYYEKAASSMDTAQLFLAEIYYSSPEISDNYAKSVKYLTMARESDDKTISGRACNWLSKCYRNGRGVPKDINKANELQVEAESKGCGGDINELMKKLKEEYSIIK